MGIAVAHVIVQVRFFRWILSAATPIGTIPLECNLDSWREPDLRKFICNKSILISSSIRYNSQHCTRRDEIHESTRSVTV
jgi:hypothetical protein